MLEYSKRELLVENQILFIEGSGNIVTKLLHIAVISQFPSTHWHEVGNLNSLHAVLSLFG